MAEVGPQAIEVRDYRRLTRQMVVDLAQGKAVRTQRRVSGEVRGVGMRQRGRAIFVYKRAGGASESLVVQRGRTRIELGQPGCTATTSRSFLGLRSSVRISGGKTSLEATQWNLVARMMAILDVTWDGLDEDGEDFAGWLKRVVEDPAVRTHLLHVWSTAEHGS